MYKLKSIAVKIFHNEIRNRTPVYQTMYSDSKEANLFVQVLPSF